MSYSVLDYFYKPKVNPYAGQKPGDVPYDMKVDPTELTGRLYERPSFWNYLLTPESAGATSAANRQFAAQPAMAQQQLTIEQQQLPARNAIQSVKDWASAKTNEAIDAWKHPLALGRAKTEQTQTATTANDLANKFHNDVVNRALDANSRNATQVFETWKKEKEDRLQAKLEEQKKLAQQEHEQLIASVEPLATAHAKAKEKTDVIEAENKRKQGASQIALMRNIPGAIPQQYIDAGLTDEEIHDIVASQDEQKKLQEQAAGVLAKEAGAKASEADYRTSQFGAMGIEANNRLRTLQQNPEVAREIASNELFGKRFSAQTGGMSPEEATRSPYIPRMGVDGVSFEKSTIPSLYEQMMPATLPSGQAVMSPDGKPLQRVAPNRPFERPVSQPMLTRPAVSVPVTQQVSEEAQPAKAGDWSSVYSDIKKAAANSKSPSRVWDIVTEELSKELRIPKQYIGGSTIEQSKKHVLENLLRDPATEQVIMAKIRKLPADKMEAIKQIALKYANY